MSDTASDVEPEDHGQGYEPDLYDPEWTETDETDEVPA